jgi:hypothetical protein
MIDRLEQALITLPSLLNMPSRWDSLIVNRRKPHTYRVFTQVDDLRICLHKFNTCDRHEAFAHPHPWPGAFIIMQGSYHMDTWFSPSRTESYRHKVASFVLTKHSKYEIINPLTWHSVIPLETTYTVMVNGPAWDKEVAHVDVRRTAGKDLDKMPADELAHHLNIFQLLVRRYLNENTNA